MAMKTVVLKLMRCDQNGGTHLSLTGRPDNRETLTLPKLIYKHNSHENSDAFLKTEEFYGSCGRMNV